MCKQKQTLIFIIIYYRVIIEFLSSYCRVTLDWYLYSISVARIPLDLYNYVTSLLHTAVALYSDIIPLKGELPYEQLS